MIQSNYLHALLSGNVHFSFGVSAWFFFVLAILVVGWSVFSYNKTTRPLTKSWKVVLTSLRACTLLLLMFCLLDPSVEVSQVTPQETYVAVLVDDSQSMTIKDNKTKASRHDQVMDALYNEEKFIDKLSENFQVRTYRFSELAERVSNQEDFNQHGGRSVLSAGINHVMNELSSFPLAGIVLVTDGADNSEGLAGNDINGSSSLFLPEITDTTNLNVNNSMNSNINNNAEMNDPLLAVEKLTEKEIPLYTVGVGKNAIEKDISIVDVKTEKSLLEGSIYTIDIAVNQQGFNGQRLELSVTAADIPVKDSNNNQQQKTGVAGQSIVLGSTNVPQRHTLQITPKENKILLYSVNVEEQEGETILENNVFTFFVDNREKEPLDILYIEGQPRNEYKFIRRAIKDDKSLRLATYLQTGPRKYLRQGINSPSELSSGFPLTAETLYQYEAIILGNVDRSFFNDKQLELVRDFVSKRGGGFMLVGGMQESFVDSPIADILPIELMRESQLPSYLQGGPRRGKHLTGQTFTAKLTKEGEFAPMLRLASDDKENHKLWKAMPDLEGIYVSGRAKPGATVLLQHPSLDYKNAPLPLLSAQRYGGGRSLAFSTASSWRWQMLMPHEDQSHERLWRQMLRWLATESQQRITIGLNQESYSVGDTVKITATLLDETFEPDNNGVLYVEVKDPAANIYELPMSWDIQREGAYIATLKVEEEGVYDLRIKVPSDANLNSSFSNGDDSKDKISNGAQLPLLVTSSRREFLNAAMDEDLLKKLAGKTNGNFYSINEIEKLIKDISINPNPYTKKEMKSFWDQPLFLMLLIALATLEWMGRRYKGLS